MRSSPAGTDAGGTRHGRRLGARSEQQPTRPPAQLSVGLEKSAALTQTQKHRSRDCDGVDDRLGTQQFRLRDRVVRRCRCRVLHGGAGGRGRDIRVERDQGGAAGGEGAGASSRPTWPRRTRRFATASGALGPPPRVGARRRTPIAVASQDSEHAGNQQQSNPREIGNTAGTGPLCRSPRCVCGGTSANPYGRSCRERGPDLFHVVVAPREFPATHASTRASPLPLSGRLAQSVASGR